MTVQERPWVTVKGGAMDGLVIRMTSKGLAELARLEAAALTEPEVIEPDQEPDDDTEAEVPDVKEDTVPDDTP